MMKKILAASALSMGVLMSGQSHAAAVAMLDSGDILTTQCVALNNNVKVQLSNKVVAAYNCSATAVAAAACHQNGTLKVQTIPCSYIPNADGTTFTPSDPQCPAYDPTAATQATQATFNGRLAYRGGSGGGKVGPVNLNNTSCDAAGSAIKAVVPDSLVTP